MRKLNTRSLPGFIIMAAAVLLLIPVAAQAGTFYNVGWTGVAIKGYDPVAYFTEKMPVKGDSDFEYEWSGARWRFASPKNLEMFKSDPEKYAPRYGGYCAYGVANNYLVKIEPEAWTVYGGRLYLNFSLSVREQWKEDIPGNIRKADANWPGLKEEK
jgi:YHS domain-containing protein